MNNKHFLQSDFWKRSKEKLGQEVVVQNDIFIFVKSTPFGKVGYIPRVLLKDAFGIDFDKLGVVYCRIDPNDVNTHKLEFEIRNSKLKAYKLRPGNYIQLPKTVIINLDKSEEDLKSQMKQKHRYNLKLAEKKAVRVSIGNENEDLEVFLKMYLDTAKRQKYFARSKHYVKKVWEEALKDNAVFIATAWFEKQPIASWMIFIFEDTLTYLYGGTSEEYRNVMGTYKLAWDVMMWAKEKGLHYFDLYGIEDNENDGFTRFKLGFVEKDQTQIVEYAQTIDVVLKPMRYLLMKSIENMRNKFKFLKRI